MGLTQLQGMLRVNFTQVKRYANMMASLGLVEMRHDEVRHRAWVRITEPGERAVKAGEAWFAALELTDIARSAWERFAAAKKPAAC
jgi:hypothetical protein